VRHCALNSMFTFLRQVSFPKRYSVEFGSERISRSLCCGVRERMTNDTVRIGDFPQLAVESFNITSRSHQIWILSNMSITDSNVRYCFFTSISDHIRYFEVKNHRFPYGTFLNINNNIREIQRKE
jgi:hypothetical protein